MSWTNNHNINHQRARLFNLSNLSYESESIKTLHLHQKKAINKNNLHPQIDRTVACFTCILKFMFRIEKYNTIIYIHTV